MLKNLLFSTYLKIFQYYIFVWEKIFSRIDKIMFIYYISNNNVKNITLNYYLGYGLKKYNFGKFFVKFINIYGTRYVSYIGDIEKIKNINLNENDSNPKRKNVILLNNNVPVKINLEILDNYKKHMTQFNNSSIVNIGEILSLIGIQCSHVTIIQTKPFLKTTESVNNVDINSIYY